MDGNVEQDWCGLLSCGDLDADWEGQSTKTWFLNPKLKNFKYFSTVHIKQASQKPKSQSNPTLFHTTDATQRV